MAFQSFLAFVLITALAPLATAQNTCEQGFTGSPDRSSGGTTGNFAINQDPGFLAALARFVGASKYRGQVETIEGFNDRILSPDTPRLEKLIRQETPYTVSLIGRDVAQQAGTVGRFSQFGLVIGDPHFGNFNIQPLLFRKGGKDSNRYSLVDLDEVSIGPFALDFARYVIFLKAQGDVSRGTSFTSELFDAYNKGLQQGARSTPSFISKKLSASSNEIRAKVHEYADERVGKFGKFHDKFFKKGDLGEFKVKNMKPEFLASLGFNPRVGRNAEFKKMLEDFFKGSLETEFGGDVKILDIAIPLRESGGSALRQRFVVSVELKQDGERQRMIVEYKENAPKTAWQAVIETPAITPAQRYAIGIRATNAAPGHFVTSVELGPTSFLMRARGNLDIETKSDAELRELALYNAYMMGLFHGGQGRAVSGAYQQEVKDHLSEFQNTVLGVADRVLAKLAHESGLRIP